MIQRRSPSLNISTDCVSTRHGFLNSKFTIKERKAAKRKEKSRVAAQIRRNKESQTLILLQNAIPLSLPNPCIMLEKSIVIRIAGQTLFLMNTLDQVLGMNSGLTIPLASNNFLTFFMDSAGQIVYASPNIQFLLEQHHWSNIIGMSISDVVNFKCRLPSLGEVVHLKLTSNPSIPSDSSPSSLSTPSSISQIEYPRSTIFSKFNLRKNSQALDYNSSTCSLFNVWCCSSINHTNAKLRLLILQVVQIKSSVLSNINSPYECLKHTHISSQSSNSLERSITWPSMLTPFIKLKVEDTEPSPRSFICIYQQMISSAHDKYYNFKSASNEFCHLINETAKSLMNLNLLDIIHLEDVIKVKSILDLILKNNDSHVWTPVYRITSNNGSQYTVRTLAKQYCTTSSHSLILNHLIIKTSLICNAVNSQNSFEFNKIIFPQDKVIALKSEINKAKKTIKMEPFIIRKENENLTSFKRKVNDKRRPVSCGKYSRLVERMMSDPVHSDHDRTLEFQSKSYMAPKHCDTKLRNNILTSDPFLPICPEKVSTCYRKSHKDVLNSFNDFKIIKPKHNFDSKYDHIYNRSPSYSLESCVLTSPGSESNDVPLNDQFIWDLSNFQEMTPMNCFLDEHFQNDLELILPI